jgi:NAD-dependent deacetylase
MNPEDLKEIAEKLVAGEKNAALTGAGVSTESGIPDFRSSGGLWEKFDPMEYATIDAFRRSPEKVWEMIKEMNALLENAEPNPAHTGLARLEELGVLAGIITQNIDNLHQEGGSKNVIEFHGNGARLVCLKCRASRSAQDARANWEKEFPPRCPECNTILKPDVVFFGEAIPPEASTRAMELAQGVSVLLVVGTSAVVAPACYIPVAAKKLGAAIVEIDLEPTVLSQGLADYSLLGKAGETVPALVAAVEAVLDKNGRLT